MPPETPVSIRWSRDRRRTLPDRLENGALEFVMAQLSRLRGSGHIRIGTDPTLVRPRRPRAGALTTFGPERAGRGGGWAQQKCQIGAVG
ncbi:hypothetical protein GCM10009743_02030 [Kribbella swartbergensis]